MPLAMPSIDTLSHFWKVLVLFLIPIGGGIPAGVLLARSHALPWEITTVLYLISDIILACLFEPILFFLIAVGKKVPFFSRLGAALKESIQKTTALYGNKLGPFALIMISFGIDPMTGRTVAVAAGHGFLAGWIIAIAGDMIYFGVIMISTIWLNNYLGDGTWTTMIIFALMMGVPLLVRRLRSVQAKSRITNRVF